MLTLREVEATLLEFHRRADYQLFDSFPLISGDATVLFTNAAITPFKSYFTELSTRPKNYALVQKCVRVGGASELEMIGVNPHCFTFFEMFGSGTFATDMKTAVSYMLALLSSVGIRQEQLLFTIPVREDFFLALKQNATEDNRILYLTENGFFWQEWRFGEPGLLGHGLTAVFSRSSKGNISVDQLAGEPNRFIELLNLIYVHSQTQSDGSIVPIPNPGFDLAVGLERLAAVLQGGNSYQIDSINPLCQLVRRFFSELDSNPDEASIIICIDHIRTVIMLLNAGLMPSNKKHGYVLRKLIRRFLETCWIAANRIFSTGPLIMDFVKLLQNETVSIPASVVAQVIQQEEIAMQSVIERARVILIKQPDISQYKLRDTYGLSLPLTRFLSQNQRKQGGLS